MPPVWLLEQKVIFFVVDFFPQKFEKPTKAWVHFVFIGETIPKKQKRGMCSESFGRIGLCVVSLPTDAPGP